MASDPGTVFESLDRKGPGSSEKTDDITGVPLAKMESTEYKTSFASGDSVSSIPGFVGDRLEQSDTGSGPEPESGDPDGHRERPRRTAEQRISQLTRRYREEQDKSTDLEGAVRELLTEVKEKDKRISELLRRQQSTAESPDSAEQPIGRSDDIRDIIRSEIKPLFERQQAIETQSRLRQEQEGSYSDALDVLPALGDVNSPESKAFRRIWSGSPLRHDPDGPLHVAYQVRGVLVEESHSRPEREARKRAASVVRPGPASPETTAPATSNRVRGVMNEAFTRLREGDDDPDTYIAARKAQRRAARNAFRGDAG